MQLLQIMETQFVLNFFYFQIFTFSTFYIKNVIKIDKNNKDLISFGELMQAILIGVLLDTLTINDFIMKLTIIYTLSVLAFMIILIILVGDPFKFNSFNINKNMKLSLIVAIGRSIALYFRS